jgi:Acyl-protein synthetase, LuxE
MSLPFDFTTPTGRRAWTRELLAPMDEAKWDTLARILFAWQYARVPAFAHLCAAHGVSPKNLRSWKDVPAMPQQVFKLEKLYARGLGKPAAIYETSGTTTGQPGRQHLASTDIYRTVSVEGARRAGLFQDKLDLHFLAFSPREMPHSSLSAMFGFWQNAFARPKSRFWVTMRVYANTSIQAHDFSRSAIATPVQQGKPIALCGTALAFMTTLGSLEIRRPTSSWRLPPGSWLLETGGFKGREREVSKAELYAQMSRVFGVPDENIWNEYGMSELSSQAYARGTKGRHRVPPWARVLVVDPASGREVRVGQKGLVRWIDLANVDSVMALQTLDLAERASDSFRLIGRMPRTEPRGCSLSVDDLVRTTINPL